MAVSSSLIAEAIRWRRDFHACPELGYQEQETSRRVAELLASFGLQVHRGLAGVVATLENGPGPVIGLRADMDALPIAEQSDVDYKSRNPGVMHACGHDGQRDAAGGSGASGANPPLSRHRSLCFPAR
jgi:hippurate hydrolase